ncbi:MAG: glycosyltransferase family 2 protein [Bacteroidetes bacterium]|nr:MAG: glycosyltransferase family 2 protein [Bacteroidota bacterium]
MQIQLSAVIITLNEERNIGRCLDSLKGIVDEVVVVDSYSTDRTEEICREKGARFIQHPFEGYIEQKNFALEQARYNWVLSLDADEALSDRLRTSILEARNNWRHDGYSMSRRANYCGQWINHSGWYPDRKLRLFDRRLGAWGGTNPHDQVELHQGSTTALLHGDLLHYSYYTVEDHLQRARKYALLGARSMYKKGRRATWLHLLFSPAAKFVRNYFFRRGFLDGRAGWTICRIATLETFWKYRALLRLQD